MGHQAQLPPLGSIQTLPFASKQLGSTTSSSPRWRRLLILCLSAAVFLVASAMSIAVLTVGAQYGLAGGGRELSKPVQTISQTCSLTRHPSLCVTSLLKFPGASDARREDLVHISVNMTLHHLGNALYNAGDIANLEMDGLSRAAYEDCLELLDQSIDHLSRSLAVIAPASTQQQMKDNGGSNDDVLTWLSAALTNQDTCSEGLEGVPDGDMKKVLTEKMKDLNELIGNCLAIVALWSKDRETSDVPIQGKRRNLLVATPTGYGDVDLDGFPSWLKKNDRRLLEMPASEIRVDFIVSKTGNATHRTIEKALKAVPRRSSRRIIIYVKAGIYYEKIKIGRKKTNIMMIGDGKGRTVVAGSKSVQDNLTTFHTATFAATGAGFIARDMAFANWAGPEKHQAVALRIGADHSVVYRCNMISYQDTLYVHSQRQFYRECDIYGTVDFIFGNAAVVLQKCNIWARRPMNQQKNTITAQNRKDPNQNTGISIHNCWIVPTRDLTPVKSHYPTYLGRPWKVYSRVMVMMSYIDDHVDARGWLEWNGDYALDTLYYGEYMNFGPGAGVGSRVTWPGHRVITMAEEASRFSVRRLITGDTWLPSTGVAFVAGLKF